MFVLLIFNVKLDIIEMLVLYLLLLYFLEISANTNNHSSQTVLKGQCDFNL